MRLPRLRPCCRCSTDERQAVIRLGAAVIRLRSCCLSVPSGARSRWCKARRLHVELERTCTTVSLRGAGSTPRLFEVAFKTGSKFNLAHELHGIQLIEFSFHTR